MTLEHDMADNDRPSTAEKRQSIALLNALGLAGTAGRLEAFYAATDADIRRGRRRISTGVRAVAILAEMVAALIMMPLLFMMRR